MINLLPPKEKIKRKQEKYLKLIWIWLILLISFLIVLVLLFLIIKIYINNQIMLQQEFLRQEEQRAGQVKELESKITTINKKLHDFNNFYINRFSAVSLIEKIYQLFPENLYLESFFWQEQDMRVTLVGYASSLEEIYQFRENIKQEQWLERASFNIPDWFEDQKVRFQTVFFIKQ